MGLTATTSTIPYAQLAREYGESEMFGLFVKLSNSPLGHIHAQYVATRPKDSEIRPGATVSVYLEVR